AADELASGTSSDGTSVPYVLTTGEGGRPAYAVVLLPGGAERQSRPCHPESAATRDPSLIRTVIRKGSLASLGMT
ncbi:MAG: hypothetical protein ABI968_10840, partial [Acidobacteriota bacterium]